MSGPTEPVQLVSEMHLAGLAEHIQELVKAIEERKSILPKRLVANPAKPSPNWIIEFHSLAGENRFVDLTKLLQRRRPEEATFWFVELDGNDDGHFLVRTNDDHWLILPFGDFEPAPIVAREISRTEAANLLDRNRYLLPDCLQGWTMPSLGLCGPSMAPADLTPETLNVPLPTEESLPRHRGDEASSGPPDEIAIADALLANGHALAAAVVRYFKDRQQATWRELAGAVCRSEERSWNGIKTWITRTHNALHDLTPPCRLRFRTTTRGYLITKVVELR